MKFSLLCVLASTTMVLAQTPSVTVVEPLDTQLPMIARVDNIFSWTFSPRTFNSSENIVNYTTSHLPAWLSFDSSTFTFHGTPSAVDEEDTGITVTAHTPNAFASSSFTLCVTSSPPPNLHLPISQQFQASNPSLSSVFFLAAGSVLATPNPALRIPNRWSFSIGFESGTFTSASAIYYQVRRVDGSGLPDWMVFNPSSITLNGVVPSEHQVASPETMQLALYASDIEGYSALALPFDLILSVHELSVSAPLPTVNVTAKTPFSFSLSSPADYLGALVDGNPLMPSDISSLLIDASSYSAWLKYDNSSRTLSGNSGSDPSGSRASLSMKLTTTFNQSINTNLTLALVPSYFSAPDLPALYITASDTVLLYLDQYFSHSNGEQSNDEVDLTVAFDPAEAGNWLSFDPKGSILTGTVPRDYRSDNLMVTFIAYSHITHSTSHTSLPILASNGSDPGGIGDTPAQGHSKLSVGFAIPLSVLGGLLFVASLFIAIRHCAKRRMAIDVEEGRNPDIGEKPALESKQGPDGSRRRPVGAPTPTKKTKIVRDLSSCWTRRFRSRPAPPIIGQPILIAPADSMAQVGPFIADSSTFSSISPGLQSNPGSSFLSRSASNSSQSIPRRRSDFQPRFSAHVVFEDSNVMRSLSRASAGSLIESEGSLTMHASEAVVQTASRATSLRSWRSGGGISHDFNLEVPDASAGRPRLVPSSAAASFLSPFSIPRIPRGTPTGNKEAGDNVGFHLVSPSASGSSSMDSRRREILDELSSSINIQSSDAKELTSPASPDSLFRAYAI